MSSFWEAIATKLNTPVIILALGAILLILSSSSDAKIGHISIQILTNTTSRLALTISAFALLSIGSLGALKSFGITIFSPRNTVNSRRKVISKSIQLMNSAKQNIICFTGDLSWTNDCHETLINIANSGRSIRILCKDPIAEQAKQNVHKYLHQPGISIRYYTYVLDPDLRGFMIDPQSTKHAFLIEKKHRIKGYDYQRDGTTGNTKNYRYWGQEYRGEADLSIIVPISKLFAALWELSPKATLIRDEEWERTENMLRKIEQYAKAKIKVKTVNLSDLKPLYRFIPEKRYENIQKLARRLEKHNIPLWKTFSIETPDYKKVIPPPIVEKNHGNLTIVDGLIRAYYSRQVGKMEITVCILEDVSEPLPGQPWNWSEVRLVREHSYTREENFQNYNPNYWRDISSFEDELI
ncbi:MAG: hypothetical protein F6K36_09065 [Symploca sp. SIO3C6]|nr:hypothetical protein [Symploca sp. SIO3C6]NET05065.1 hypothetical protein [Symploca sp. SIO2B6]